MMSLIPLCFKQGIATEIKNSTPVHKHGHTQNKKYIPTGYIDSNFYYDTRNFNVFTLNVLGNLPLGFQYFSLTNFFGLPGTNHNFSLNRHYTEQNLRWNPVKKIPIDLTAQGTFQSGRMNNSMRLGIRWRVTDSSWWRDLFKQFGINYSVNFHPLQIELETTPGHAWQIEHVYKFNILPKKTRNRLYISGFADHNMRYGGTSGNNNHVWVTEHQLGVRIIKGLHAVAEFRRNEFMQKKNGLGLGFEYLINF